MKNLLITKTLLTILFIASSIVGWSQDGPPPMAMPTTENKALIDEIIKVTDYEAYFRNYCLEKIDKQAAEKAWTSKRKEAIIKSIDFKYFNATIYNLFAFYSAEELKQIIELYKKLNRNKFQKLIVTNDMVEGNLELFADSVAQGKYVL